MKLCFELDLIVLIVSHQFLLPQPKSRENSSMLAAQTRFFWDSLQTYCTVG